MSALHLTRRDLLSASAVAVAGIAGCSDSNEPADTPQDSRSGPPDGAVTDLDTVSVRRDRPDPFVSLDGEKEEMLYLVESADEDALTFDPEPPKTGKARELVEETNFETHAVGVFQERIGACRRRHTEYVIPKKDDINADFCNILRDATVACESDGMDMVATFVRFPYTSDEPPWSTTYGSGSSCESAHWATEESR